MVNDNSVILCLRCTDGATAQQLQFFTTFNIPLLIFHNRILLYALFGKTEDVACYSYNHHHVAVVNPSYERRLTLLNYYPYFLEQKPGLKYKPGLEYRPGVRRNCANRGRALNTSRALNISRGSWFTYWSSLTGMHCLQCASWHDMKLGLSVFWLPYSYPLSKPITNLLRNVLIVSLQYT